MQRIERLADRHSSVARSAGTAGRNQREGSRLVAKRSLEQRLTAEFWRYTLDVPEDAFPSFLESLYFEPLTEGDIKWTI